MKYRSRIDSVDRAMVTPVLYILYNILYKYINIYSRPIYLLLFNKLNLKLVGLPLSLCCE